MAKAKIKTIADTLLTIRIYEIQTPRTSPQAKTRLNVVVIGFVEVAGRATPPTGDLSIMTPAWTVWAFSNLSSGSSVGMTHTRQKS
jgi:hypothetical protein